MARPEMLELSRSEIGAVATLLDALVKLHGTRCAAAEVLDIGASQLGDIMMRRASMRASVPMLETIARHHDTTVADMLAGRARSKAAA